MNMMFLVLVLLGATVDDDMKYVDAPMSPPSAFCTAKRGGMCNDGHCVVGDMRYVDASPSSQATYTMHGKSDISASQSSDSNATYVEPSMVTVDMIFALRDQIQDKLIELAETEDPDQKKEILKEIRAIRKRIDNFQNILIRQKRMSMSHRPTYYNQNPNWIGYAQATAINRAYNVFFSNCYTPYSYGY